MDVLEQLLAEFFGPNTSTERKRSIEAQLDAQRLTLDDCRYMLTNARSDYLGWFAASQYQKRIQLEWASLDPELQRANRSFLVVFLQQHFGTGSGSGQGSGTGSALSTEAGGTISTASSGTSGSTFRFSNFVLNKVVQLLTDIALMDWPDRYQDLFPEIHSLLQSKNRDHALLGWTLLEATVQEFVGMYPAPGAGKSHRAHLTLSKQRWYLWENFKAQIPDLLNLIVQHLDQCYNKMLVTPLLTEAPAPSPVEHSIWSASGFGRRPSLATPAHLTSPLAQVNGSFQNSLSGSRAVPGSLNPPGSMLGQASFFQESGQRQGGQGEQGSAASYGKSPTTTLRKTLSQFLGSATNSSIIQSTDSGSHINLMHSPAGPGISLLQARQRMGSISDLGQMAMRRSSINAAVMMEGRRGSIDSTFISGNRMDSHSRKTCTLALQALTALLACPGIDPRRVSFSSSIAIVLKFSTLHQNKTVDLGILSLSCLNGLVARPGFLANNQEAMTGAVRIMADLIRYFNEVKDGIDDIDESYLQMFMHFVSLFCTLVNLERAERALGLSKPDFIMSFAKFTLEKVSVDYLKICMDVWKTLLDAIIHSASESPRPIPAGDPLRRMQGPLLYFMSALVEKFYKMKGATRSEDAFSTFEVEDEEDLEDLTDLVESFVGLVAEVFTEEVIEMLNPLLNQQLELYSNREIDECKTLPVTLGILSKVANNFDQNFEDRRTYTCNLMIHLTRMTKFSVDHYIAITSDATGPGKGGVELTGTITLALFHCLSSLISWVNHLWKVETSPESGNNVHPKALVAREIYQELAQLSTYLFRRLLPTSALGAPSQLSTIPSTFLGPASTSCSAMDRRLLLSSVKTLRLLTLQVRIPLNLLATGDCLFWDLESTREMASVLSQAVMTHTNFMGEDFVSSKLDSSMEEDERKGITPDDELFLLAYLALSNGITLDPKTGHELQTAALQAFGQFVAPIIYPLQSILQDSRSAPGTILANSEAKFRVHRCLTILRTLVSSVEGAAVSARAMVYEGVRTALPLVQEYFEVYLEDHDISIDILLFFKSLVKTLYRQVGTSHCMEIARVLMDRLSSPPLFETAFSSQQTGHQQHQQALHQQSFILQQRKVLQRVQMSVSILNTILELPSKEISMSLTDFAQFLFSQLGPKLLGTQDQRETGAAGTQAASLDSQHGLQQPRSSESGVLDNGVYDLMSLFFSTIQTMLTHHCRYFFAADSSTRNQNGGDGVQDGADSHRAQMLQSCMEYLARGLHRPEPDIVRQSIEIIVALQEHSLCHLFDRQEFQSTYRFEFLKLLLQLALSHQQDLLLEDMAGLIHSMVKGDGSGGDRDEKFLNVWHGDLKRFVAGLEPSQVLVTTTTSTMAGGLLQPTLPSPQALQVSASASSLLAQVQFPDSVKEALWMNLLRLGDASMYREGLYDFMNDAHVYAQNLIR
ncbi:armadillo-type protein [Gamsiella multidivaricata]|uniref:armadillo-type protein n=1 Tax=Gamsiella multidivaricata TaxID=101098 RepID=UPI002220879B|nr:armadillo-type protein [Gamsiella multidivaricata]KAI7822572.1 armadillo-type protein [Gamsiella multidivaricata]